MFENNKKKQSNHTLSLICNSERQYVLDSIVFLRKTNS